MPVTPKKFYELRLKVDLSNNLLGRFEPLGPDSRQWFTSPNGVSDWTLLGPDTQPPLLVSRPDPEDSDRVQFKLTVIPGNVTLVENVQLFAVFGAQKLGNSPIASPFRGLGNDILTSIGLGALHPFNSASPVISTSAFGVNVPSQFNNPSPLKFEFTVMARFTLPLGRIRDFVHDPEMEVEIGTATKTRKKTPAAKKAPPVKRSTRKKAEMVVDIGTATKAR